MKRVVATATALGIALTLSACAGGQGRGGPPKKVINRVLATAPGEAQPSTIVAVEIAYARDASEQGYLLASENYAASRAQLHGRNGPVPFAAIVSLLKPNKIATQWKPRTVVMSCDGELALSQGRFVDGDGLVGNYVTTWERQDDGSYKWSYDVAGHDDPQPPKRPDFEDGDIVVTAIDSIKGLVATCAPRGVRVPAPPAVALTASVDGTKATTASAQTSRDGTLRWRWEHRADGTKYVKAEYFYEGGWEVGIEESLASPPER